MSGYSLIEHSHQPMYGVVRTDWTDPLDVSYSQGRPDNRWNTAEFPALYCCCCERVARAVTLDVLRLAGVELDDLQVSYWPQLVEVLWSGRVVDAASAEGVAAAGLPASYPQGAGKDHTRRLGEQWHGAGAQGVVGRSASLARMGFAKWEGAHEHWSEVAIFTRNCDHLPALVRRREDLDWFWQP